MTAITTTDISKLVDEKKLLAATLDAITTEAVDKLVATLPVVPEGEYRYNQDDPTHGWQQGKLHWYPVGGLLGNQAKHQARRLGREPHRRAGGQRV